jgi:hypothetical protein
MNSPRGSVVGYGLRVDKFIGNVKECEDSRNCGQRVVINTNTASSISHYVIVLCGNQ